MKKRNIFIISLICIIFIFTGCNANKAAITKENFISTMESENYYITDASDQFANYESVDSVTIASKPTGEYQIEFYVFEDEDTAIISFNVNKENFEQYEEYATSHSSADINNYSMYSLTITDSYKFVSRKDNTMIYIDVAKEYKDEVKEIIDKLGY